MTKNLNSERSNWVWYAGSDPAYPNMVLKRFDELLPGINLQLGRNILAGSVFERPEELLSANRIPAAVVIDDRLMRNPEGALRKPKCDIAPLVPRLLREAGLAVPTLYIPGETRVDPSQYRSLGYTAISQASPDPAERATFAVQTLQGIVE